MTSSLVLLVVVGGMVIGGFLYIRKLSIDANLAKELIQKNQQLQERHNELDQIEKEKDAIIEELHTVKSGSSGYRRILSKLGDKWPNKN